MSRGPRSDMPYLTDAQVRAIRARRMTEVLLGRLELDAKDPLLVNPTIEYIGRCLQAHEVDTLKLLSRELMGMDPSPA